MKITFLIVFASLMFSGTAIDLDKVSEETSKATVAEDIKIFDFDELEAYLSEKDEQKTYVVNFWATWCAPCVKELPYFEQLNANYSNKDVEVILVSLDFSKQIETKLKPFLKKNVLKSEVLVLSDVDANTWIPKVDKNWSGSIPATLIYNKALTKFYERSFDYQELETELKQFIK